MSGTDASRADLARSLGVTVSPALLEQALTHRSFAYENGGIPHNERLEFLGDSILGQAVTVMLYRENPHLDEGDLAKRRASLVSTVALAEVAHTIGLGDHIRLGRGEVLTGGNKKSSILADTVEAVIGAVYLDAGPDEATAFVLRLIRPLLENPERFGAAMDPKTSLQELAASIHREIPVYTITDTGPDHSKRFHAIVSLGDEAIASGDGTSKKQAEMAAALDAWTLLHSKLRTTSAPAGASSPAGAPGSAAAAGNPANPADSSHSAAAANSAHSPAKNPKP